MQTKDGPGKIVGYSKRRNTNGGPGCNEMVVRLDDQRVRHYSISSLKMEEPK